jgi:hypothetical protein
MATNWPSFSTLILKIVCGRAGQVSRAMKEGVRFFL